MARRLDIAVFPLPNAVLFPGTCLPLHLVEARYERMLEDIQARGWLLALPLAIPHGPAEFALNTICGAGSVQLHHEYGDGRLDILVHGKKRVRLLEFVQQAPYLVMEAEPLDEHPMATDPWGEPELESFRALVKAWAFMNPDVPEQAPMVFDDFDHPGRLADFFVFHFFKRAPDKQVYLNTLDPLQRSRMLARFLETDLIRLSRRWEKRKRLQVLH